MRVAYVDSGLDGAIKPGAPATPNLCNAVGRIFPNPGGYAKPAGARTAGAWDRVRAAVGK